MVTAVAISHNDGSAVRRCFESGASGDDKEDVLRRGISKLVVDRKLSLIYGPNRIQSHSHVLYVGDVLILCKGIKRNLEHLNSLLSEYVQASGQHINLNKSKFYTCNASHRKVANLCSILSFNGFLFKGKHKRVHLQPIADRIFQKLANWKESSLSITGKVELVKSIINSMLVYSFLIYSWPSQLIKNIDGCIRNFIWAGDINAKKLIIMAWKQVCSPTIEGFALLKLAWEMMYSNQDWAIFYRNRFGKKTFD
ncbi:hypothetical protein Lal_00021429 [Lupinus albus]|nr:hypothetical protein Lal_00021429 [Lupinus albus]